VLFISSPGKEFRAIRNNEKWNDHYN